ncbi:MAG: extracellular solute-binding protein [Chloroflexaceae bacterium]|nr:extracellular solute-binding protein [Chloroflexaceae bacterium]
MPETGEEGSDFCPRCPRCLPGLFLLFLLLLLAACGFSSASQQTTLVFWHAWPSPDHHILAHLIDRYNQTHPTTQVIPQAMSLASLTRELRAAALAGSGPHLVLLHNHTIGALAQGEFLLPLDHLVAPEDYAALLPTAVQGAQVTLPDGTTHLYGIPLTFDTLALYYHKGQVRSPPEDVETLLQVARDLTSETFQPPGWGLACTLSLDKTIGYLPAFGGQVFDSQGNLVLGTTGRPGTERWLRWLATLRQDRHILAVSDSITVDSALKARQAMMTIDWSHALPVYQALWDDALGVAPLPQVRATGQSPRPYVQSYVLSLNARVLENRAEQDAALDFVRYLVSEDAQEVLLEAGKQPVLLTIHPDSPTTSAPATTIAAALVFRLQAQQGQAMPDTRTANAIVRDELEKMQLAVLRGLATPSDAVTHAEQALRDRLGHLERSPQGNMAEPGPEMRY